MQKHVSPIWSYFNGDSCLHALAYSFARYNKQQFSQILDWFDLGHSQILVIELNRDRTLQHNFAGVTHA